MLDGNRPSDEIVREEDKNQGTQGEGSGKKGS